MSLPDPQSLPHGIGARPHTKLAPAPKPSLATTTTAAMAAQPKVTGRSKILQRLAADAASAGTATMLISPSGFPFPFPRPLIRFVCVWLVWNGNV